MFGQARSRLPAPTPRPVTTSGGRSKRGQRAGDRRPGWRHQLEFGRQRRERDVRQLRNLQRGRRGQRQQAVLRLHLPGTVRQRRRIELLDAEILQADGGADDVHDGVDRAHLVEVHVFHRLAVHARFRLRQKLKDGAAVLLDPLRQVAGRNHGENVAEMAVPRQARLIDIHTHAARAQRALVRFSQRPTRIFPATPADASCCCTCASGTPASIRLASSMSPLMPEKQSQKAIFTYPKPLCHMVHPTRGHRPADSRRVPGSCGRSAHLT